MLDEEGEVTISRRKVRERVRRSLWRRYRWHVSAVFFVALAVGLYVLLLGDSRPPPVRAVADAGPPERTSALPPLSLPRDEGPHVSATEWWYYTGQLVGKAGERYAFHATVFLRDGMVRHTVLHFSLTDLVSGKRVERQMRTAGIPSEVTSAGFDFRQQGWRLASDAKNHVVMVQAEGSELTLDLKDSGVPMLHRTKGSRTPGLLDFGAAGISYYYSRPGLSASGTVTEPGGKRVPVQGEIWFDHQWGDFESSRQAWNWFALQLDDGASLMIYQLFDTEGRESVLMASLQENGRTTSFDHKDLKLTRVGTWRSAKSGVRYPAGWDIDTPLGRIAVRPEKLDSEFNGLETTFKYYWEGAVKVSGARTGKGFLEMSGYDHIKAVQPPE